MAPDEFGTDTIATLADVQSTYEFWTENGPSVEMVTHILDVLIYARRLIATHALQEPNIARSIAAIALRFAHRVATWRGVDFLDIANRCYALDVPVRAKYRLAQIVVGYDALSREEIEMFDNPPTYTGSEVWYDLVDAALFDTLQSTSALVAVGKAFDLAACVAETAKMPPIDIVETVEEETGKCSTLDRIRIMMSNSEELQ